MLKNVAAGSTVTTTATAAGSVRAGHTKVARRCCLMRRACFPFHHQQAMQFSTHYDKAHALRKSGRFFRQRWSNCTPHAVVACVALAQSVRELCDAPVHAGAGRSSAVVDAFADAVRDKGEGRWGQGVRDAMARADMASFAALYTDANMDKEDLQVALYIQALLYHKSAQRRVWLPSMRNPVAVAEMGAARVREHLYREWVKDVGAGK